MEMWLVFISLIITVKPQIYWIISNSSDSTNSYFFKQKQTVKHTEKSLIQL